MEFLGNWQFWLAVAVVTLVVHYAMAMIMPKLGGLGGGTSGT